MQSSIKLINHASVKFEFDHVKILTDPWYEGSVFHKGWKLIHKQTEEEIVNSIILSNMSQIRGYLGKHFCLEKAIIFRNYNFQEEFSGYNVYSNVWHQDSFDGNRLLKIFVLLDEVSDNDGPFHYHNLKNNKVHWEKLKERWSFKKFGGVEEISDQETFTGKIGDYLIMGTSRLMHRA